MLDPGPSGPILLFGTLHVQPGPAAVPTAFTPSAQLALLANLGFVVLALLLVLALPRRIPGRAG